MEIQTICDNFGTNNWNMNQDTICALATAAGMGAIAVIRLSGPATFAMVNSCFKPAKKGTDLMTVDTHTLHFGTIEDEGTMIDEVLVSIFKGPKSYTGEDTIEISCHGSVYIQNRLLQLFLKKGCRMAKGGEFTFRAFMNGKLDLTQAEAVSDLISSKSEKSHHMAVKQMRGGFSKELTELRKRLIKFASLIELELDFSTEDVEFADRSELVTLLEQMAAFMERLIASFKVGNAIKNGVSVALVGEPNVGKSTLLNALLNEDRAIVSSIAGTTRDVIEDEMVIEGVVFRFVDTAGIREAIDEIESIGIEKTFEKIQEADIVCMLFDAAQDDPVLIAKEYQKIADSIPDKPMILLANKIDKMELSIEEKFKNFPDYIAISAKEKKNIEDFKSHLLNLLELGEVSQESVIVNNSRHYDELSRALECIEQVKNGLEMDISGDLLALDIRQSLFHIGEITGNISTDDLLDSIFRDFCIGK